MAEMHAFPCCRAPAPRNAIIASQILGGEERGGKKSDLNLDKKCLKYRGVNQFRLARRQQGLHQKTKDRPCEIQADAKGDGERQKAPEQAAAQLNQMIEQRHFAVVDIAHGLGAVSLGGVSAGVTTLSIIGSSPTTSARGSAGCAAMMRSFSAFHFFSNSSSSD